MNKYFIVLKLSSSAGDNIIKTRWEGIAETHIAAIQQAVTEAEGRSGLGVVSISCRRFGFSYPTISN